jgi:hypothetical protein
MAERPKTGIEVKFVPNDGMKASKEFFHFFHLDKLAEAANSHAHLLITLDGEKVKDLLTEPHVRACSPGEHTLEVALQTVMSPSDTLSEFYYGSSLKVNVPEGTVVVVHYTTRELLMPTGHNGVLEVVGPAT